MTDLYYKNYESPVGLLRIYSDGENVVRLTRNEEPVAGSSVTENDSAIDEVILWLDEYFAGNNPPVDNLPLNVEGSQFRLTVSRLMSLIPYGRTVTYGEIADAVAKIMGKEKMSAQAVGGAVGWNPIPIIIPCHRVVGKDGCLTGFSCGIDMKQWLLEHEGHDMSKFHLPKNK